MNLVESQFTSILNHAASLEKKSAPKKKAAKKGAAAKKDEAVDEAPVKPKGDPFYWGQLNDIVRSERFETR